MDVRLRTLGYVMNISLWVKGQVINGTLRKLGKVKLGYGYRFMLGYEYKVTQDRFSYVRLVQVRLRSARLRTEVSMAQVLDMRLSQVMNVRLVYVIDISLDQARLGQVRLGY